MTDFSNDENTIESTSMLHKIKAIFKNEIVSFMHKEKAYIETKPRDVISFDYSRYLQI